MSLGPHPALGSGHGSLDGGLADGGLLLPLSSALGSQGDCHSLSCNTRDQATWVAASTQLGGNQASSGHHVSCWRGGREAATFVPTLAAHRLSDHAGSQQGHISSVLCPRGQARLPPVGAFSGPSSGPLWLHCCHPLDLPAAHGALGRVLEDAPGTGAAEVQVAAGDEAGVSGAVEADNALIPRRSWKETQGWGHWASEQGPSPAPQDVDTQGTPGRPSHYVSEGQNPGRSRRTRRAPVSAWPSMVSVATETVRGKFQDQKITNFK